MSVKAIRIAGPTRREVLMWAMKASAATAISGGLGDLLAACGGSTSTPGAAKHANFGNVAVVNFAPVWLMQQRAKDYGFTVDVISFPNGTERINALAAGAVDLATSGETQPIIVASQGVPVKIVAATSQKGKGLYVGNGINSFADLRGKTIGSIPGTGPDIFMRQKLKEQGLDPNKDVSIVNVDYPLQPQAVASGRVAAASGNEPFISVFLLQFHGKVLSYLQDTKLGHTDGMVTFANSFVKNDRGFAKTIVSALAKATADLQKDPSIAIKLMQPVVPGNLSEDILRQALTNLDFVVRPDVSGLTNLANVMFSELGIIKRLPAVSEFVDTTLLDELNIK